VSGRKIQLVLDDEAIAILEAVQKATGAGSISEVLRDALGVYSALQKLLAPSEHLQLALVDRVEGVLQVLQIPSLMRGRGVVVGLVQPLGNGRAP
jgi:hypothetical protein